MAYGCDECAPQICPSGRTAYSGKTDSRYRRKQCILKKLYKEIHGQNMPIFIKNMPKHSPADRQQVMTIACIIRPKAQM